MAGRGESVLHNAQILRFVAAFMVLFGHVQHEATEALFMRGRDYTPWAPVFLPGGVDIFFVLSGFIMMHLGHASFGQPRTAGHFLVRRWTRVAPMYWLFTTLMVVALLLFPSHVTHKSLQWGHVLASYVFLPWENAYGKFYPILILGWTLNFEMFFYGVMALALTLPRRWGPLFLVASLGLLGGGGALGLVWPDWLAPLRFWGNPIVLEFLMGIGVAWLRIRGLRLSGAQAGLLVALALCWMVLFHQGGITGTHWVWRWGWMGVPAALLVLAAVCLPESPQPPAWKRWLSRGGDWSFAIYLSHPFSLTLVAMAWQRLGWESVHGYIAASVLAGVIAGKLVHELIEVPVTRGLKRRVDAWLRPAGPQSNRQEATA